MLTEQAPRGSSNLEGKKAGEQDRSVVKTFKNIFAEKFGKNVGLFA
jgi:hypothetical protein